MVLHIELGTVIAQSDGSGHYAKGVVRAVPIRLTASVDETTIEREHHDSSISFAVVRFEGYFEPRHWDSTKLGHMYTDTGIEKSINQYLKTIGYNGVVNWSEHGRQEVQTGDFDSDYALIEQFWPQLKAG